MPILPAAGLFLVSDKKGNLLNSDIAETTRKTSDVTKDVTKDVTERQQIILDLIVKNNRMTIPEMSLKIKVTERTIKRDIAILQKLGLLSREGGRKDGIWVIQ